MSEVELLSISDGVMTFQLVVGLPELNGVVVSGTTPGLSIQYSLGDANTHVASTTLRSAVIKGSGHAVDDNNHGDGYHGRQRIPLILDIAVVDFNFLVSTLRNRYDLYPYDLILDAYYLILYPY